MEPRRANKEGKKAKNEDRRRSTPSNFGSLYHQEASGPAPLDESDVRLENPPMTHFHQYHQSPQHHGLQNTSLDYSGYDTSQTLPRVVGVTPRRSASCSPQTGIGIGNPAWRARRTTPSPLSKSRPPQSAERDEGSSGYGGLQTPSRYGMNTRPRARPRGNIPGVTYPDMMDSLFSESSDEKTASHRNEGPIYSQIRRKSSSPQENTRVGPKAGSRTTICSSEITQTGSLGGSMQYASPGGSVKNVSHCQLPIDKKVPGMTSRIESITKSYRGAVRLFSSGTDSEDTKNSDNTRFKGEDAASDSPVEGGFIEETSVRARNTAVGTKPKSPSPSPSTARRFRQLIKNCSISKAASLMNSMKKSSSKKSSKVDSSLEEPSLGSCMNGDTSDSDEDRSSKSPSKSKKTPSEWFKKSRMITPIERSCCNSLNVSNELSARKGFEEEVHSDPDFGNFYYPNICKRVPHDFFAKDQKKESSPKSFASTCASGEEPISVRWTGSTRDTMASVQVIRNITRPLLDNDGIYSTPDEFKTLRDPPTLAVADLTDLVSEILRERYRAVRTYDGLQKNELVDCLRSECESLRTVLRNFRIAIEPLNNPKKPVKQLEDFIDVIRKLWELESAVLELFREPDINSTKFVDKIISTDPDLLTSFCRNLPKYLEIPAELKIESEKSKWNHYIYQIFKIRKNFVHILEYLEAFEYQKQPFLCSMDMLLRTQMERYTDMIVPLIKKCSIPPQKIRNIYFFADVEVPKFSSWTLHMIRFEKLLFFVRPANCYYICVYHIRVDQIYSAKINEGILTLHTTKDVGVNSVIEIFLHDTDDSFIRHFFYDVLTTGTKPTFETEFRFTPSIVSANLEPENQKCVPFFNFSIIEELHKQCTSIILGSSIDRQTSIAEEINKLIENERHYVETLRAMQNPDLPPACNEYIQVKLKELYAYHSQKFYPKIRVMGVPDIITLLSEFCSELIHYEEYIQLRTFSIFIHGEDKKQIYFLSPMRQLSHYLSFLEQLVLHNTFARKARFIMKEIVDSIQRTTFQMHSQLISGCKLDFFRLGFFWGEYGVAVDSKSENINKKIHTLVVYTKVVLMTTHNVPTHNFYKALWFEEITAYRMISGAMTIEIKYKDEKEHDFKFKAIDAPSCDMEKLVRLFEQGIESAPSINSIHSSAHKVA